MKKLTELLDDELFELHKNCWVNNGELRSHGVTLYAKKVSELYQAGYNVKEHIRFISYYRGKLLRTQKFK